MWTVTAFYSHYDYHPCMPEGLKRYYGTRHLHFITCSCYQRKPYLDTPRRRDLFLRLLEETRQKYRFIVVGYVVTPEHFHLLICEPQLGGRPDSTISAFGASASG